MAATSVSVPPVLSTPDNRILSETVSSDVAQYGERLSDEELYIRYEIRRTVEEIKKNRWKNVALQFPDEMLRDSTSVFQLLARGLDPEVQQHTSYRISSSKQLDTSEPTNPDISSLAIADNDSPVKLTILADTSYGSCCIDEIAAEHVNADVVVHYGRSCLSPTSRLPVIYVFTSRDFNVENAVKSFILAYPEREEQVIITADVPFANHVDKFCTELSKSGYSNLFPASLIHDPSSLIPNRTIPDSAALDPASLKEWHLFHISDPPTSLLLALASRVASVRLFSTSNAQATSSKSLDSSTSILLRRRYALITSLSTVAVWGILINTLSVQNYTSMVQHVKSLIAKAGKKSYMFVVGKLNAAKLANFSDIGGWVVIGCWESSLVDSKDFFKPIITPFELDLALRSDNNRIWTGSWRSDFGQTFEASAQNPEDGEAEDLKHVETDEATTELGDYDSEEESEPPDFDLRTGRYISRSRSTQQVQRSLQPLTSMNGLDSRKALVPRGTRDITSINGVASPAAEFLAQKRNWRGLGSDFQIDYENEDEGAAVEEGLSGVPRGYSAAP